MMRATAALAAILLTVAACAAGGGARVTPTPRGAQPSASPGATDAPGPSATIAHLSGATDLVLRIDTGGGLVPPGFFLAHLPDISVYGGGRIVTQGPVDEVYPGPALPDLRVTRVSEAGIQRILAAAREAGLLGPDATYPYPGIMDAPTTTFVVGADGATHTTSAYALGIGQDAVGITPEEAAARVRLVAFSGQFGDLQAWLGSDVVAAEAPYVFDAVRMLITPGEPTTTGTDNTPTVVDWPLAEPLATSGTPLDGVGQPGMRCMLVTGDDLATVLPLLEAANQRTYLRSAGATWAMSLRPLLPDEAGCPIT
jgi:hypothetical protein